MKLRDYLKWDRAEILRNIPKIARLAARSPEEFADLRAWWSVLGVVDAAELDAVLSARRGEQSERFLNHENLRELTGYKSAACQAKWLKRQGVRHYVSAHGRPVVMWASLDGRPREGTPAPAPINWEAVR